MMSEAIYPRLWQLFAAYFHQDWDLEGNDWPDLVRNFADDHSESDLIATAAELDQLLADFGDDTALNHELFEELGCSYMPRPDLGGPTVRSWLGEIAAILRTEAGRPN